MEYMYPSYFYDFQCEASACKDTCCAAWEIMIDPVSLKKYKKYPGSFGSRLKNCINWKRKSFEQCEGRCAFLNEENLCDIYTEAGKEMLCKTCTRYPRHYEEYENLREISLSLSCPAAARLILGTDKPMTFDGSFRKTPEEEYEEFDFFLFTKLEEIRDYLYEVVQNRELDIRHRMALALASTHDLQSRITRSMLYEVDDLLEKYQKPAFAEKAMKRFDKHYGMIESRRQVMRAMMHRLHRLEVMRPQWTEFLHKQEHRLYGELSPETYGEVCREFDGYMKEREYEYEQLLMYFLFTYFCGAVYDENAFGKVKFAVVCTLLIRELGMGLWLEKDKTFTLEDQIDVAHCLSREIEHSDPNLNLLDEMMEEEELFTLERLLSGILGEMEETREPVCEQLEEEKKEEDTEV